MRAALFALAAAASQLLGAAAANLEFQWPTYPEANVEFPLSWVGGTPPYTVYVLTPDLTKYYYKYTGSGLATTYNFPLTPGTQVAFECLDSANLYVTSPTITVIATLDLNYPNAPEDGVASTITWTGGEPPYTVYALTTDLSKYYYKYTGSDLQTSWTPNVAAGTEVVFQIIDSNGVKATGNAVTVGGGSGGASQSSLSVESTASLASVASVSSLSVAGNQESQSILSVESTSSVAALSTSIGGQSLSMLSVQSTASIATVGSATITSASSPTNTGTATTNIGFSSSTRSGTSSSSATVTAGGGGGGNGTGSPSSGNKSSSNVGAIAGGVVGGVLGLALIALLGLLLMRKNKKQNAEFNDAIYGGGGGATGSVEKGGVGEGEMREPTLPNTGYSPSMATGAGTGSFNPQETGGAYGGGGAQYGQTGYQPSMTTAGAAGIGAGAGAGYYAGQEQGQRPMSEAYSGQLPYAAPQSPPPGWQGQPQGPSGYDQALGGSASHHGSFPTAHTGGTGSAIGHGSPAPAPSSGGFSGLPEV